ncbi:hypothetical protein AF72_04730 [Xylella taiwanensis]|uniref:Uncharacterized protein n=1 Tax=Xylella taiwanensis TaxID=1444770 RepID=Z9JLJ6_9GAMM|nr:hypothetical protein AF72_04730 [Xylella taiwanensis]
MDRSAASLRFHMINVQWMISNALFLVMSASVWIAVL